MFVEHKGSLMDTLKEMQQDLQSSISYAGGKDLKSLRTVDYVIVRTLFSTVIEINIYSR
ncbi:putative GMP reductase [Staphylococcus aureus]|uniref:Putative GMP reductase n=1 Tax=Staphylococcus aureus TaxID=1280 RepID=A0A380EHA4_STAAU|nr:putative GMP reductase [Staphylococcus aureus]